MSLWASHCLLPGPPPETTTVNRTPRSTRRLAGFERAVGIGHDDVGRQRVCLRAKAIDGPRAHAGKAGNGAAAEQLVLSGRMDDLVAVARTDDGDVVDAAGGVRKKVRDLDA